MIARLETGSPSDRASRPHGIAIVAAALVCAPVAGAALFVAWMVAAGLLGRGPYRPVPPRTLAEAALLGDAATAVRRIREGWDPNRPSSVSAAVLPSGPTELLPLEAAALGGDSDMVALMQRRGASLPPEDARRVACDMASRSLRISKMLAGPTWDAAQCAQPAK